MTEPDLARIDWDAIVIGTGMGGATLGHALARRGQRVLFCERGASHLAEPGSLKGAYPELHAGRRGAVLDAGSAALLASAGRDSSTVVDASGERPHRFAPYIGSGTGGSSALYGMALERFAPSDFEPRANYPQANEATLVDAWPVRFDAFCEHYAAAEALYRVRGTADPLNRTAHPPQYAASPPPLTSGAAELFAHLRAGGLHPYPLPMACEFVPGCECCQGYLCDRGCKNDSASICLAPALRDHGATLLDRCEVLRIDADRSRATGVVCRWRGTEITLRGKRVILAAGALQTPNLLLRSRSALWPDGLANGSGWVGRNLMRHCIDLYLVASNPRDAAEPFDNRPKEFAFNDFYSSGHTKLGSVQSFGRLPPGSMLFGSLVQDLRDGALPWAAGPLALARPLLQPVLQRLVDRSITLATTMEDLPYADNRVQAAESGPPGDIRIAYRLRAHDHARVERFRSLMSDTLKARRWRRVKQAENNQRLAHVCGTCRFGTDPRTSVLDPSNRCHELDNLYVVDSSFFPSSGGTNPSLTIAANALRVAGHLA